MTETIFGMSGCFPVSQGQEMKDLTASSGRKATRGCQCSFSARVMAEKQPRVLKIVFVTGKMTNVMEYITFFDFAAYTTSPCITWCH